MYMSKNALPYCWVITEVFWKLPTHFCCCFKAKLKSKILPRSQSKTQIRTYRTWYHSIIFTL